MWDGKKQIKTKHMQQYIIVQYEAKDDIQHGFQVIIRNIFACLK